MKTIICGVALASRAVFICSRNRRVAYSYSHSRQTGALSLASHWMCPAGNHTAECHGNGRAMRKSMLFHTTTPSFVHSISLRRLPAVLLPCRIPWHPCQNSSEQERDLCPSRFSMCSKQRIALWYPGGAPWHHAVGLGSKQWGLWEGRCPPRIIRRQLWWAYPNPQPEYIRCATCAAIAGARFGVRPGALYCTDAMGKERRNSRFPALAAWEVSEIKTGDEASALPARCEGIPLSSRKKAPSFPVGGCDWSNAPRRGCRGTP